MAALNDVRMKERQFDELLDYSHYVVVNEVRHRSGAEDDADLQEDEALFTIAHFMIKNSAWDP